MNSRDKQQGDPEICRESVTIPMVQSVYGSQPQIRAGIGPTEHVRQMSEQELVKQLTIAYCGRESAEVLETIQTSLLPIVRQQVEEATRICELQNEELKEALRRCAWGQDVRQQSVPDATGLTELVKWLQSEAEKRIKLAEIRKDSAEAMRGATADELRDAKRTAEKMSGRNLDLASTTVEAAQKSAEIDEKIAAKYVAESSQLSQWAAELVRQAKRETALLELAIEMSAEAAVQSQDSPNDSCCNPICHTHAAHKIRCLTPADVRKRYDRKTMTEEMK